MNEVSWKRRRPQWYFLGALYSCTSCCPTGYQLHGAAWHRQHKGRVDVWEATYHLGTAANLPIQPLNYIIGADSSPVLTGKIAVSQRFLNAIFHLLCGFLSFMKRSFSTTALAFSRAAFLLSCSWISLSILAISFTLERGVTENTLR